MSLYPLILFLPAFLLAMGLSRHRALGRIRNSALNPMLLVAFFVVLAAADFAGVATLGYGELGQKLVRTDPGTLAVLTTKFGLLLLAFVAGVGIAFQRRIRPVQPKRPVDLAMPLAALYLVILAVWFVAIGSLSANYFSLEGSVETKLASAGNVPVFATSLLLLPALCYALPRQRFMIAVPLVLLTVAIVFFSGSRTRLLYALVPFLFYLVMVRGVRIPRSWFLFGVLAIGLLSIVALNTRVLVAYGRAFDPANVLAFSNPLNSNDMPLAEASIALSKMEQRRIAPYPGENLVSFFAAPIPRALLPIKPDSGSVQFTKAFDPARWRETGSGLVIGAVNEIQFDYPYPIAFVLVGLFGFGWGAAFIRAVHSPSIHGFAATVALYLFIYNFFRADLFLAGSALIVFLFYGALVAGLRQTVSSGAQARKYTDPRSAFGSSG